MKLLLYPSIPPVQGIIQERGDSNARRHALDLRSAFLHGSAALREGGEIMGQTRDGGT
jgi:hypothetical protein